MPLLAVPSCRNDLSGRSAETDIPTSAHSKGREYLLQVLDEENPKKSKDTHMSILAACLSNTQYKKGTLTGESCRTEGDVNCSQEHLPIGFRGELPAHSQTSDRRERVVAGKIQERFFKKKKTRGGRGNAMNTSRRRKRREKAERQSKSEGGGFLPDWD